MSYSYREYMDNLENLWVRCELPLLTDNLDNMDSFLCIILIQLHPEPQEPVSGPKLILAC